MIVSVVRELNHIAVRTADMDAALHFYQGILGGKIIRNAPGPDGKTQFAYVQLAEGVIELIKGQPGGSNLGLQHIAFLTARSEDINSAADKARARGYQFTVEPKAASSGDGYLCFFKDKGGAVWEFIQREEDIRVPGLENERILEFDHIAVQVDDESCEDTKELVEGLLGMEFSRVLEKPGAVMSYYKLGPDRIMLYHVKDAPRPDNPIVHFGLRVPCARAMYEYLTANGVEASEPRVAGLGGFYVVDAVGPDGERLMFLDRGPVEEF